MIFGVGICRLAKGRLVPQASAAGSGPSAEVRLRSGIAVRNRYERRRTTGNQGQWWSRRSSPIRSIHSATFGLPDASTPEPQLPAPVEAKPEPHPVPGN